MVEILFIKGQPPLHLVAKAVDHLLPVTNKGFHHPTVGKTVVAFSQRQRHIEVIEADHRLNAAGKQFINKLVIKGDTFFIELTVAFRANAAPGNLEAVAVHAQILHQVEVFPVAVVRVGCHLPVGRKFRRLADIVNRHPFPALIPRPFGLHTGNRVTP